MKGMTAFGKASRIAALTLGLTAAANAAERPGVVETFVSGLGNDSNASVNCPRTKPCRTLAGAYPVTLSGGEIIALDPADYGRLTITGPISILGVEGAVIAVASGTTGITINAHAADKVVIRHFSISGAGAPNTTGIALTGGHLVLRDSTLKLLTTGLSVRNTHADVLNTDIIGNGTGIFTDGVGVKWNSAIPMFQGPGVTEVRIAWGSNVDNTTAFVVNNPTASDNIPSATIWIFAPGSSWSNDVTGYTTLMTLTGTGSTGSSQGPQEYIQNSAPN